jgi:hypothetical protein
MQALSNGTNYKEKDKRVASQVFSIDKVIQLRKFAGSRIMLERSRFFGEASRYVVLGWRGL